MREPENAANCRMKDGWVFTGITGLDNPFPVLFSGKLRWEYRIE
jgi:hypothetical protein